MNKLNKDIRHLELSILGRKNDENQMKKDLEFLKLEEKNKLNNMDTKFSNEQKREAYVDKLDNIKDESKKLQEFQFETQVMEIELRFKLREFDIFTANIIRGMYGR